MSAPTRPACLSSTSDAPGEGARFADRHGIPHPVWCRRAECDLELVEGADLVGVMHIGVVLPVDEQLGVELLQLDLVTLDGRHLERGAAEVRAYLPSDGGHLYADQAGRLAGALAAAQVLAGDLPAFERGAR